MALQRGRFRSVARPLALLPQAAVLSPPVRLEGQYDLRAPVSEPDKSLRFPFPTAPPWNRAPLETPEKLMMEDPQVYRTVPKAHELGSIPTGLSRQMACRGTRHLHRQRSLLHRGQQLQPSKRSALAGGRRSTTRTMNMSRNGRERLRCRNGDNRGSRRKSLVGGLLVKLELEISMVRACSKCLRECCTPCTNTKLVLTGHSSRFG